MKRLSENLNSIEHKTVIVRCNFDVPIQNGVVEDTTRIEDAIETIKQLRQYQAKVVLLAHYDRPDGKFDPQKSLKPIVPILEKLVGEPINFVKYNQDYTQLKINPDHSISLVDNLRFWDQEEENDPAFGQYLASLGEVYVNQAFANCHREHASIVGIPKHLPHFAGINLAKEIDILSKIRNHPDKPLVVIIGGAKLETKEPLIEVFADKADHILVGGKSAVDLQGRTDLPTNVTLAKLIPDQRDITEAAAHQFANYISQAKTVIWNGTMGVFEEDEHQQGTQIVAQAVNTTPAFTLVGGGDTETALTQLDLQQGIDFISSGGGAMLTYLSTGTLVGIEALE